MSRSGRGKRKLGEGTGSGFEQWGGYMNAKIQKLQEQFSEETPEEGQRAGQRSDIFKTVAIFVNGYTRPPSSELKTLMMQHGGTYHHYYRRGAVTHIIASNLPNSKATNLTDKKVVKPDWIADSIAAGKLLSHEPYLLFTSRTKSQPGLQRFTSKTSTTSLTTSVSTASTDVTPGTSLNDDIEQETPDDHDTEEFGEESGPAEVAAYGGPSLLHPAVNTDPKTSTGSSSITRSAQASRSMGDARDPSFISEFYNNSRLHHISTWGAEYKALVRQLQTSGDTSFPGRSRLRAAVAQRLSDESVLAATSATGKTARVIMHIDMDCFFVSVGLRKRPDLLDKPVAVTHSRGKGAKTERPGTDLSYEAAHYRKKGLRIRKGPGRGQVDPNLDVESNPDLLQMGFAPDKSDYAGGDDDVFSDADESNTASSKQGHASTASSEGFHSMADIASCNYAARQAGVRNGMCMGKARTLCPELQTIPYDFDGYQEVSQCLYRLVASYTHDIEAVSCDEMLVDCSDLLADTGATPTEFAELLRKEIKEKTGCNASAGLGPNILLARMATRVAKPNGQFLLEEHMAKDFIKDKAVADLPGVGRAMVNKLSTMNITTCGELQAVPLGTLQRELGTKTGQGLYRFCRGEDTRSIRSDQERKSVSAEVNYGIRFTSESDVARFMRELSGEVHTRLDKLHVKGKTITLKLKVRAEGAPKETAKFMGHGICNNVTKSVTVPMATDNPDVITKEVMGIVRTLKIPPTEYRGIGIQVSRLEAPIQRGSLSKGHQSILNFAAKPTTPNTSRTESASTESPVMVSKKPSPCASDVNESTGRALAEAAQQDGGTANTGAVNIQRVTPPNTRTPSGAATANIGTHNIETHKTGTAGASEVRVIPGTNVIVTLPPLPTLPDFKSPPNYPPNFRSPPPPPQPVDILLPSPSQVDMEVLKELPPDLREQIEGELASRQDVRTKLRPRSTPQSQVPTTSTTRTSRDDDPIVALPSFSQLDPSCMEALPPEMRAELIRAYKRESGQVSPPRRDKSRIHPLMQPKNQQTSPKAASPHKASPGRQGKGSPNFKKPHGRGPGRPRRELNFGKPAKSTNKAQNKPTRSIDSTVSKPAVPAISKAQPSTSTDDTTTGTSDDVRKTVIKPQGVNLCGAETVAEVKALLKEWSLSCDAPEREDSKHLIQYLHELVADRNLERVYLVLVYFRRCIRNRPLSAEWEEMYRDVCNQGQAVVQATYGSRLKL